MIPVTETLAIIIIIMAAIGAIIFFYVKRTGKGTFKLGKAEIGPFGLFTLILCAPGCALLAVGLAGDITYLLIGLTLFIFGMVTYYIDLFQHRKRKKE
jgi:hypothetical protein